MNNDLILTSIASYLSKYEIFRLYRELSSSSRGLWRGLVTDRRPTTQQDVFEVYKSSQSRLDWLEFLIGYIMTNQTYGTAINGDTIVHKCARRGDLLSVYLLLHVGIADFDPNMPGSGGMTVLHCAAAVSGGAAKLCQLLLRSCDPSLRDDIGRLPEDWANKQHAFEVSEVLRTKRLPAPSIGCFPSF